MLFAVKFMIIDWRHIFWRFWHFWQRSQQKHRVRAGIPTYTTDTEPRRLWVHFHSSIGGGAIFLYSPSWFVYFCFGYILLLLKIFLSRRFLLFVFRRIKFECFSNRSYFIIIIFILLLRLLFVSNRQREIERKTATSTVSSQICQNFYWWFSILWFYNQANNRRAAAAVQKKVVKRIFLSSNYLNDLLEQNILNDAQRRHTHNLWFYRDFKSNFERWAKLSLERRVKSSKFLLWK